MKLTKKAKNKWVRENVYSFEIEEKCRVFTCSIHLTRSKITSFNTLNRALRQLKDVLDDCSFESGFWKAKTFALEHDYSFTYERKLI